MKEIGESPIFCILLGSWILITASITPRAHALDAKEKELKRILERCADYCDKLGSCALDFVCLEKIHERIFTTPASASTITSTRQVGNVTQYYNKKMSSRYAQYDYTYDYQLIRKEGRMTERRILLEENGSKVRIENAPLKTQAFRHKTVVFGPLGLLGREAQRNHDFKIKKYTKYKGDAAVIIEAKPKKSNTANRLYGKVWVKRNDYSILKIEFEPESLGNYQTILTIAKKIKAKPRLILESEYEYEKNGIRFPSSYLVRESYISRQGGRRFNRSETKVTYQDYKFFTVATDVEIK